MKKLPFNEVYAAAIAAGAEPAAIEADAVRYARQVKSVPFNNMIYALNLCPWHNGREEWARLAAAMRAKQIARKVAA